MGINTSNQFRDGFINAASSPDAIEPPAHFVNSACVLRRPRPSPDWRAAQEWTGSCPSSRTSCALADTSNFSLCWREYSVDGPFNAPSKLFNSLAGEGYGCSTVVQRNRLQWRISASWPETGSRRSWERAGLHRAWPDGLHGLPRAVWIELRHRARRPAHQGL